MFLEWWDRRMTATEHSEKREHCQQGQKKALKQAPDSKTHITFRSHAHSLNLPNFRPHHVHRPNHKHLPHHHDAPPRPSHPPPLHSQPLGSRADDPRPPFRRHHHCLRPVLLLRHGLLGRKAQSGSVLIVGPCARGWFAAAGRGGIFGPERGGGGGAGRVGRGEV